jgi:hypothetical protein
MAAAAYSRVKQTLAATLMCSSAAPLDEVGVSYVGDYGLIATKKFVKYG